LLLFGNFTVEGFIAVAIALLVGMTVHEFAHNYVGHLMGDPVPAREGRLTLNPLVHINPIGWLMFLIVGFGILGQAPIAAHRMRNPRWGYLAAVAAGPFSNLLIAVVVGFSIRVLGGPEFLSNLPSLPRTILIYMVYFNVLLFLFNLLPLFPIDGWYIAYALLPPDLAYRWERWQTYSTYVLFGLILISFAARPPIPNPLGIIIGEPTSAIVGLLLGF
jgi:Zn-dependent protease